VFGRRRRPLMRAAMVGGTAYAVGKHAQRGAERESEQEARIDELEYQQQAAAAPAPAPPTGGPTDIAAKLTELKSLLDQGIITQEEFDAAKQKALASY
jgi:Short C-terminal domain